MANYTKLKVIWKNNLHNIYKENTIIGVGQEAVINLDKNSVSNIYVNFKVNGESYTNLVEINGNTINVPFNTDVLKKGTHELEIVAYLKNGDVVPSPIFSYVVDRSLENPNNITAETNYPILIQLLEKVEEWNREAVAQEIIRVANETQRIEDEEIRISNENNRNSNENERKTSEDERNLNENERNNSEEIRISNENNRISNENNRNSNENNRISNENERNNSEEIRISNENNRENSEDERVSNEEERISNETQRKSDEIKRLENETQRLEKEKERLQNEINRQNEELKRVANETQRLIKEEERITNESIRKEFYGGFNDRLDGINSQLVQNVKEIYNISFIADDFPKLKQAVSEGYKNIKILGTIIATEKINIPSKTKLWGDFYSSKIIANYNGDEGVIQIGKNCLIEGLAIYQGSGYSCYGIEANNTGHSIIRDCDIYGFKRGAYFHGVSSPGNHVLSTWIHDCKEYGLCYEEGAHFARIENCDITGNVVGVYKTKSNGIIEDNNNYEYGQIYSQSVNCKNNSILNPWTEFSSKDCFIIDGGAHNSIINGMCTGAGNTSDNDENYYGIVVKGNASNIYIDNVIFSGNKTNDVKIEEGSVVSINRTDCGVEDNTTVNSTTKTYQAEGKINIKSTKENQNLGIKFLNNDYSCSITSSGQNLTISAPSNLIISSNVNFSNKTIFGLGQLRLPVLANAPTATEGNIYYNSTLKKILFYDGSQWVTIN